ncbi:hypothetical protein ACFIJ5_03105 [Haloimpatiens sp. FM7330]|uniref:hypothetical protein n=1 Tax=Haloimpatiens sp. FM7330 TaxID=3298610 RepID=UPI00363AB949
MRKDKSKIIRLIFKFCIVLIFIFTFSYSTRFNNTNIKIYGDNDNESVKLSCKKNSKDSSNKLVKLFCLDSDKTLDYRGYAEYGYFLRADSVEVKDNKTIINMLAKLHDQCTFADIYLKYEVDNEKIIQKVNVNYSSSEKKEANILNSIIPEKVILKLPLKKESSWEQKFEYNGKEYKALTKIENISEEKGVKKYETKTIVDNIKGFQNNKYVEKCVYEEGKGLVKFDMTVPINSSYSCCEGKEFGYSFNNIIIDKKHEIIKDK